MYAALISLDEEQEFVYMYIYIWICMYEVKNDTTCVTNCLYSIWRLYVMINKFMVFACCVGIGAHLVLRVYLLKLDQEV